MADTSWRRRTSAPDRLVGPHDALAERPLANLLGPFDSAEPNQSQFLGWADHRGSIERFPMLVSTWVHRRCSNANREGR